MKIVQLISGLGNGGAEKFVVELSNQLAKEHNVLLCSFKPVEDWMIFPKQLHKQVKLLSLDKKTGLDLKTYSRLFALLKREKPDILHFHLDATIKYVLPLVFMFPSIKFVHTLHSDLNAEKQRIFGRLQKAMGVLNKIKLVCISPDIKTQFEQRFKKLKFNLVENGLAPLHTIAAFGAVQAEVNALKPNPQTTVFISVGRLDENKNQELLVKTFRQLQNQNSICLLLGHDPSAGETYKQRLLQLKASNVFILGTKTNIADYLHCAHAFLMSSLYEGQPIAALEALEAGLPIITTPAGGMQHLIANNENGFVTNNFSVEAMSHSINHFLQLSAEKKQQIQNNNRQKFLSRYDIDICAANYLSLYQQ